MNLKRQNVEKKVAECYSTWGETYYQEYYGDNAPYPPVHLDIIKSIVRQARPKAILDAGCGPASILRHFKDTVPKRYGFDLTPEMVEEARRVFVEQQDNPSRIWKGSVLKLSAFSAPGPRKIKTYPMILCTGVLPHIQPDDDAKLFKNIYCSLQPRGTAVIEGRNELFSLFTLNRYSHEFLCEHLIGLSAWRDRDRRTASKLRKAMEAGFRMDLPPIRKGKWGEPGYDEVLSRLHNPLVVEEQLLNEGFKSVEFRFYHYHCVPPQFAALLGPQFLTRSLAMEKKKDWRGYFMASAFLAIATR